MSSFVHCMVCFVFPVPDLKFYLSTCGHVACFKCVQKGVMTLKCKVCQKESPRVLEINRNLKPELRQLFAPLVDFSTIVREVTHSLDFQSTHRIRLMRHLHNKSSSFEALQKFCREEVRKKNQYKS
ncbi:hypothetical protein GCK32_001157 [Trichostrongylus colubriformis]|uniref:RING-type domain-containing protein n=1 Tax=Trichostrongylus colubriformis TaxID=6319 RepID=A0AAN8IPA2_TRICO